jgi:thiosulfate/3-mercaptopyruvate sulfurtransferase
MPTERLVTADWLVGESGRPGLVIVESDEDVLLYDTGHIPGRGEDRLAHTTSTTPHRATTSMAPSSPN